MKASEEMVRGEWKPTRVQMRAYLDREVEMAREKIRIFGWNITPSTLHSVATMQRAMLLEKAARD